MKALVSNRFIASRLFNLAFNKSIFTPGGSVIEVPKPTIGANETLVKVKAVALNPTDFKHLDIISPPGSIIGCDYAGEVAEVGSNATALWKVGDRVAGAVHGGLHPDRGSFAEYLKVDADLAWRVPSTVSDADATTYGVSAITAMLSLNLRHGLSWADEGQQAPTGKEIFIYGGSTSAGLFHVQLAKIAGYKVITTASSRSADLVKSYGADAIFDYNKPNVAKEIGPSTEICTEILRNSGGKVVILLPNGKSKVPGVTLELIMAYTLMGKAFQWLPPVGPKFEASPTDRAGLARFYKSLPELTATLKPVPVSVSEGGFTEILAGLDKLRQKKVAGSKLVVKF
ncbi:Hps1-dma1 cluster oxidoreductase toxD like protein [Verticillium longisporum]|nr:Hps1-dma1 cluster oxidoreductase toxD like protein [Verticillium longisporum]